MPGGQILKFGDRIVVKSPLRDQMGVVAHRQTGLRAEKRNEKQSRERCDGVVLVRG